MSKYKQQDRAERIYSNAPVSELNSNDEIHHQTSQSTQEKVIHAEVGEVDDAIRLRAYQIYQEKGGSDLDNWLEAERILGRTLPSK